MSLEDIFRATAVAVRVVFRFGKNPYGDLRLDYVWIWVWRGWRVADSHVCFVVNPCRLVLALLPTASLRANTKRPSTRLLLWGEPSTWLNRRLSNCSCASVGGVRTLSSG